MTRRCFANLEDIIEHIDSPHADKVYVGKDYTIADLMDDLRSIEVQHLDDLCRCDS